MPRRSLFVALLALVVAAPTAQARLIRQHGRTTLSLGGPAGAALDHAGVTLRPGGAARRADGGIAVPVVTGVADTRSLRAVLAHAGELRVRKGHRLRVLRRPVLVRGGAGSALLAQVRGAPGGCGPVTRALGRFPRHRALVHAVRRTSARLCRHARVIVVARVVHRRTSVENGVADGTGRLRLRRPAVSLLDAVAGRHAVHTGMGFGTVSSTTCALAPCPPRAILGIFTTFVNGSVGVGQITDEAQALGVSTVRFSANAGDVKPAVGQFASTGLRVVLAVRNGAAPSTPPTTAAELAGYRTRLATTLGELPAGSVVQIENEENAVKFFSGTMAQYGTELAAAVGVAHAHGLAVTNGGLTFKPLVLMAWQELEAHGHTARADALAEEVFDDNGADRKVLADLRAKPFTGLRNANLQAAWDRAKQLVPIYRSSAMDWVNFHWYGDDDRALTTAVHYLEGATGKPAVTTEIGQYDTQPGVVTGHLTTLIDRLHLPLVMWFDADGHPALGLHDAPGKLRANGRAFKSFVRSDGDVLR